MKSPFLFVILALVACAEPAPPGRPPPTLGDAGPPPPVIVGHDCESGDFEIVSLGEVDVEGETMPVAAATPCEYVLSHVQGETEYPIEVTDDYVIVDSDFHLPHVPGLTDAVAWTPGNHGLGWATNMDVREVVAELGPLPVLYHVRPGYQYGYFVNDGVTPGFEGFRPAWRFVRDGEGWRMDTYDPADPNWPRHRGGWNSREINQEIGFGLLVDEQGRVYIPRHLPLAIPAWNDELRCVVVNRTDQPVPVTRTQFPGDESYYMAETILPGFASISSPGHLYWGHRGVPMIDVARWDGTLPGNFDKPYTAGCSAEGYNAGQAEGFTWPELRAEMRDAYLAGEIDAIPAEHLYSIELHRSRDDGPFERLGRIGYAWDGDEWLPVADGEYLISVDASRNTNRISGALYDHDRAIMYVDALETE